MWRRGRRGCAMTSDPSVVAREWRPPLRGVPRDRSNLPLRRERTLSGLLPCSRGMASPPLAARNDRGGSRGVSGCHCEGAQHPKQSPALATSSPLRAYLPCSRGMASPRCGQSIALTILAANRRPSGSNPCHFTGFKSNSKIPSSRVLTANCEPSGAIATASTAPVARSISRSSSPSLKR